MELKDYIREFSKRHPIEEIKKVIDSLNGMKVLIIGEAILDDYWFVYPVGRATKDPIISTDYRFNEVYPGGSLAVANHIANYAGNVELVTLLGEHLRNEDVIRKLMNNKIKLTFFTKEGSPTIIKRRFIDSVHSRKLFKMQHINEAPISEKLEKEIISYLENELPKYDAVVVSDFGHGFITENIIKTLEEKSKFLCVNAQTNSSNLGYHHVTRYKKRDFATMNLEELKMAMKSRFGEPEELVENLQKEYGFNNFIVTLSKRGLMYVKDGKQYVSPVFTTSIKDTVGAGDALFSIGSLLVANNSDPEIVSFLTNSTGAVAAGIIGNKESVTKEKLLDFVNKIIL